ncbi:MAG: hypothetical protein ACFFAU_10345 [Candidatus Hodarchaeota archaeon]
MSKSKRIKLDSPEAFMIAFNRIELIRNSNKDKISKNSKYIQI